MGWQTKNVVTKSWFSVWGIHISSSQTFIRRHHYPYHASIFPFNINFLTKTSKTHEILLRFYGGIKHEIGLMLSFT